MAVRTSSRSDAGSAPVHLHLHGPLDNDAVATLRQQLALLMSVGVVQIDVDVDVDEGTELDLPTLQVMQGADKHLAARGGHLRLLTTAPAASGLLAIRELTTDASRPARHPAAQNARA